eukprot:snap_masked-scaffold_37-processed-gene-2.61-mRNA-1 protein AED:1.00 eAED:1.00 QI:0/0/0/0/1/1/2/0/418
MSSSFSSLYTLPSPKTTHSGYLYKQTSNPPWTKLYFSLDNTGTLSVYKDATQTSTPSTFSLQQNTKILNSEFRDFCFEIRTPGKRKIVLAGTDEEEKRAWIKALLEACKNSPPRLVKICVVGDDRLLMQRFIEVFFLECGRKELAKRAAKENYLNENIEVPLEVTGERVNLVLCCVSNSDYPQLRRLNYVNCSVFLLCYSTDQQKSLESIENVWLKEINSPEAFLYLIGIQGENKNSEINQQVGQELAAFINAMNFYFVNLGLANVSGEKRASFVSMSVDNRESEPFETRKEEIQYEQETGWTPGETFLQILEETKSYVESEVEEVQEVEVDVGNLSDFRTSAGFSFATARNSTVNFFKRIGGVEKLKGALKKFKRMKPRNRNKARLRPEERERADFMDRQETGSLVFLGDIRLCVFR